MQPINFTEQKHSSIPRQELMAVIAVCLLGALVRCLFLSETAIEHFDEGVYASNLWFSPEQGAEYPGRYFYAPPLIPFLIEWSMIFLGSGAWATFLPSLLLGILTVPLVWWIARDWFGAAAGLVAAILASFSDLHMIYSRAALTDVGLAFFLLLSVYFIWMSYLSQEWKWSVLAGVIVGVGWAIKYNGWLPLAIGLSGLLPWLLVHRPELNQKSGYLLRWGVVSVTAFLVWSPVFIGLQKYGGYSVVASNHSRYIVGFSGWWDSFSRQVTNHRYIEGTLSYTGLGLICLVLVLLLTQWNWIRSQTLENDKTKSQRRCSTWNLILWGVLATLPLMGAWMTGTTSWLGILAMIGILLQLFFADGTFSLRKQGQGEKSASALSRSLAAWLLAAWFCGLLLTTPLYYPYPRLTIPWTISAWLGAAAFAGWLEQRVPRSLFHFMSSEDEMARPFSRFIPGLAVVCLVLFSVICLKPWRVAAWQPRNGLAIVSQKFLNDIQASSSEDFVLYTYAEPGIFFNLHAQGHQLTAPVADFQFLESLPTGVPVYMIAGPHAARDLEFQKKFDQVRDRFDLVKKYEYAPSLLVRLNQSHISDGDDIESILLYRAK